jgi:TolA-binding protein
MGVIGRAEAYRSSLVFAVEQGPAAPPWLQALNANINAMRADVTALRADVNAMQGNINNMQGNINNIQGNINTMQGNVARLLQRSNEEPIILANSRAGNREPLYDPTQLQGGWAAHLIRPAHRDDLLTMSAQDCITTAIALGLPPLLAGTAVVERRRQIARRIGVSID